MVTKNKKFRKVVVTKFPIKNLLFGLFCLLGLKIMNILDSYRCLECVCDFQNNFEFVFLTIFLFICLGGLFLSIRKIVGYFTDREIHYEEIK